jgi:hypothetical protein
VKVQVCRIFKFSPDPRKFAKILFVKQNNVSSKQYLFAQDP